MAPHPVGTVELTKAAFQLFRPVDEVVAIARAHFRLKIEIGETQILAQIEAGEGAQRIRIIRLYRKIKTILIGGGHTVVGFGIALFAHGEPIQADLRRKHCAAGVHDVARGDATREKSRGALAFGRARERRAAVLVDIERTLAVEFAVTRVQLRIEEQAVIAPVRIAREHVPFRVGLARARLLLIHAAAIEGKRGAVTAARRIAFIHAHRKAKSGIGIAAGRNLVRDVEALAEFLAPQRGLAVLTRIHAQRALACRHRTGWTDR